MAMSPPSRSLFKDTPTDLINVNGQTQLSVTSVLVHSFDTFSLVYIYRYITGSLELEHFLTLTWEKKKPLDGANGQ